MLIIFNEYKISDSAISIDIGNKSFVNAPVMINALYIPLCELLEVIKVIISL